jgi:Fur family transcriptional regulator, ferric uptake regulator
VRGHGPSIRGVNRRPASAPPPGQVVEGVLAVLRQHGGRATPARRLLLAALTQPGHHTAEEIAAAVRQQAPDVHLTTIYRNLDELERLGIVDRTYASHGPATYHLASAAHGHLACETCGAITELPREAFQTLSEAAMARHGFAIIPSRFAIPGLCARCRQALAPPAPLN